MAFILKKITLTRCIINHGNEENNEGTWGRWFFSVGVAVTHSLGALRPLSGLACPSGLLPLLTDEEIHGSYSNLLVLRPIPLRHVNTCIINLLKAEF